MKVPANKYNTIKFHLRQHSQVKGTLTHVAGGSGNDINYAFLDPEAMVAFASNPAEFNKARAQRVGPSLVFNFVPPVESDYFLVLDNTFSPVSDKQVDFTLHFISPISHDEITRYQIQAIYETIQKRGCTYVNAPISYAPGIYRECRDLPRPLR